MPPDALEVSDESLMAALAGGDDAALAPLMSRWEMPLKRYLQRIVFNHADAEELAQETFVRLYQSRQKYDAASRFTPWLYAIASNLAKNRLRWRAVRRLVSLQGASPGEVLPELADTQSGTSLQHAESAERAQAVRAAIQELPLELRTVVVMFEYEGLSHRDIAQALGCTPKAAETRLYRARSALRAKLSRWLQP